MMVSNLNKFFILLVTFAVTKSRLLGGPMVGGWSSPLVNNIGEGNLNQQVVGKVENGNFKCSNQTETVDFCAVAKDTLRIKNKETNTQMKLLGVCNPESQVVAGTNYKFTLLVEEGVIVKSCDTKVYKPLPYTKADLEVQRWNCVVNTENARDCQSLANQSWKSKRSLLGGQVAIDINQDDTQEAAKWAVEHINQASNSLYMHCLQKVLSVTKQVINGYRYRISLTTVPTLCRNSHKNYGKTLEMCSMNKRVGTQICEVSVIYSSGKYSMETFKCMPGKKILGGDDHDYKPHKRMLGGDDHDYKTHGKNKLLGGDDHDYKPHSPILGGDDHDFQIHRNILGGDDHDKKDHGIKSEESNNLPGGDIRQTNVMRSLMDKFGMPDKQERLTSGSGNVQRFSILGGDDHDYRPHESHCTQYKDEFEQFKVTHQRFYGDLKEETQRFQVFCENMVKMKKIQENERGSAKYGVTQFSDLTEEEFQKQYLGLKPSANMRQHPKAKIPTGPVPDSWDWRDHGAVTPVKSQGACGSCWAFSTTGNVEGQWAINKKKLLSLSEQELVDCDKVDEGCNGGLPSQAYDAIMKLGGLETESDYKYKGYGEKCLFNKTEAVVKVTGAVNISQDETEMAAWLYHNGPISIGINAFAMQFYWGGVAHPWKFLCNPKSLDHGVLIVGFGVEKNEPYWIVKNSWGPTWGRKGYYYVYRGDGTCGLNTMCTSATVE